MAKKAQKTKKAAKAAKQAAKATRTAQKAKSRSPRAQTIPGLEGVRYGRLDGICERIAEIRETLNEQRTMEGEECREALKEMRDKGISTYRFAGVELSRVPGEEKLRVRTSKEKATAETEEEPETPAVEAEPDDEESSSLADA